MNAQILSDGEKLNLHPIQISIAMFNEDFDPGRRGAAVAEQPGASGLVFDLLWLLISFDLILALELERKM